MEYDLIRGGCGEENTSMHHIIYNIALRRSC